MSTTQSGNSSPGNRKSRPGGYSREGYLEENWHWFHLRDTAGQERDFHFHDFDKLVILLEGKVRYLVESEDYALSPGDVLLVRHHCIHKALIDRSLPYERVIVYLDRSFFMHALPEAQLLECFDRADRTGQHLLTPDERQLQSIRQVMNAIERCPASEPKQQAFRDTLIMQLLLLCGDLKPSGTGNVQPDRGRPDRIIQEPDRQPVPDDKIHDTLSYIMEHLDGDLSVDRLSERVFLSRYHFMRMFRAQTGQTVHAFVLQKRLLSAARLVRSGIPAVRAAALCGFQDYSSFHRAFVKWFGCTPGSLKG